MTEFSNVVQVLGQLIVVTVTVGHAPLLLLLATPHCLLLIGVGWALGLGAIASAASEELVGGARAQRGPPPCVTSSVRDLPNLPKRIPCLPEPA